MTNKEILQDALNILEPIPADKWTSFEYIEVDNNNSFKCCALGHYGILKKGLPSDPAEFDNALFLNHTYDLRRASEIALSILHPSLKNYYDDISIINNRPIINGYTEPEIKDRVIHFLKDAVAIKEDF